MKKKYCLSLGFTLFFSISLLAQTAFPDQDLLSAYEDYAELPREIAYLHLNKSTYIKGEDIGFTAYVLDRENNRPSLETTNLYCTISDFNGKVLKSKLILVQNGISDNNFAVDSLFTSGEYTFKAYTNWMKNFKEQNYFVQKIKIIDPEVTSQSPILTTDTGIDAQFLPEGGHLLAGAKNTVGVVIKDEEGFGIPFLEGNVFDSKGKKINTFKVNEFGIGKFPLRPERSENYEVKLTFNGEEMTFPIENIDLEGVNLMVHQLQDKVALEFNTNEQSLPAIREHYFKLAIHNGKEVKITDVVFGDALQVIKAVPNNDLFPGINIFTLFDENNTPILERQFFNFQGLSLPHSNTPVSKIVSDSVSITLPFPDLDPGIFNAISISVLPADTKSYDQHHNLRSYVLLQPYVKGTVENADYYFTDIDNKKKYELDNLLLTQGWSSYEWGTVFNNPPDYDHDFEKGIGFTLNVNGINGKLLLFPTTLNSSEFIDLEVGETTFQKNNLFPFKDEKIRIGEINDKGKVKKPNVYLQFEPASLPDFYLRPAPLLGTKANRILDASEGISFDTSGLKRIEELDEVVLTKTVENTRIQRLKNRAGGKIDVFDDKTRRQFQYFANYISQRGFAVNEDPEGNVFIVNRNPLTPNNNVPIIFLDGAQLNSFDVLYRYRLDVVDYIEVNPSGLGGGLRGGGGIIKIHTDPIAAQKNLVFDKTYTEFDIPLTFDSPKEFYVPRYTSYSSNFFRDYGVIDWFPQLQLDRDRAINLKIKNTGRTSIRLFIEGVVNDGSLLSEIRQINLE